MEQPTVRACLITNPKSGHGKLDLSTPIGILRAHGWEVVVREKLEGGMATDLAKDAAKSGFNVVVDCGGDGTLNELVEGVVGTDVAVGTLPGGTANIWSHEVGISQQLDVAARQLAGSERRRVDVGVLTVNGKHKHNFILMAGLGFDGAVIERLSKTLKHRVGKLAYGPALLSASRAFHPVEIQAQMDEIQWEGRVTQIIVGNSRRYAGVTSVTPAAFIDDGLLDVCLITANGPLQVGRQLGSLLVRQQPSVTSAQMYRAATVRIQARGLLPVQVDGGKVKLKEDEVVTPDGVLYELSVVPQGVCVLIPRMYNGSLFQPQRLVDTLSAPLEDADKGKSHKSHEKRHTHNGNGHQEKGRHGKTLRLRVLSVGVDDVVAMRLKNGKLAHVSVTEDTRILGGDGGDKSLGALSTLNQGDLIEVEGEKDGPGRYVAHTLRAKQR
ncbi:MAG TPA: diacylglycerol kinase family protein [Ktedonobacterales bacterium]